MRLLCYNTRQEQEAEIDEAMQLAFQRGGKPDGGPA